MRSARADDHWRHLTDRGRKRPLRLHSLAFQDAQGVGDGIIDLHPAFTVICGANGVGKTTLLRLCALTLGCESIPDPLKVRYLNTKSYVELSGSSSQGNVRRAQLEFGVHTPADGLEVDIVHLDVGDEWFRIRNLMGHTKHFDELLEQHGGRELNEEELKKLRYLTGKPYTACRLYEIDEFDGEDRLPFPYCIIVSDGDEYGLEEMGAGEGALFLMWWTINRMKKPGILLLEEPETHITSRSQRALMDLLAEQCSQRSCCVMTTHSADVISHIPKECLRLVVRHNRKVQVYNAPDDRELQTALGVDASKTVTAVVEDRVACIVAKELLRVLRPDISYRVHVSIGESNSRVIGALANYPVDVPGQKLVGVLDGDQKTGYSLSNRGDVFKPEGLKHPLEFLPWTVAPDEVLRNHCCSRAADLARALGIPIERTTTVLSALEGVDHHDWIEELAKQLELSVEMIVLALLGIVVLDDQQRAECEIFANRMAVHALS